MNRVLEKIFWIVGWLLLFLCAFWLSIPSKWAAGHLEKQINQQVRPLQVRLADFQTGLTGFTISQLSVHPNGAQPGLKLTNLQVSLAPWDLVLGRCGFSAELYQGTVEGSLSVLGGLWVSAQSVEPNRDLWVRKRGLIRSNPNVAAQLNAKLFGPLEGDLRVQVSQLLLSGKTEHTDLMMALPDTMIKKAEFTAILKGKDLNLDGNITGDLKGTLTGRVSLNMLRIQQSQLNLRLNGELTKEYKERLGFIASLLQSFTNSAGRLSVSVQGPAFAPQVKRL